MFEVLLPDGHKLWPDWLRRIDTLLEDDAVIEVVAQALEARWPQSRRRGRPGTPAPQMAGFASVESVDTSLEMAGFAAPSPGRPRPRKGIPAASK